MTTPVGVGVVTSLARRYIMPEIVDVVYASNPYFFRLNRRNKKLIRGGYQIEVPFVYKRFGNGGPYSGMDPISVAANDTVKNGAWDWKQHAVTVAIDGLTLIKVDSPDAIADVIKFSFAQAEMEMAENLAIGIMSDGVTNPKEINGLRGAIDAGAVTTAYAGLTRSANPWLNSQVDTTTTTLSQSALNNHFTAVGSGGRTPSIVASRSDQYNRFYNLGIVNQQFNQGPAAVDDVMMQAGFTNLLFNNVPWLSDSHVFDGANASNSVVLMMNEDYFYFAVSPKADFYLEDFQKPIDQDAMAAKILWAGNFINSNPARQGKMTAVVA